LFDNFFGGKRKEGKTKEAMMSVRRTMMRMKYLFVALLLTVVVSANAGLSIWIKIGDDVWADYPDSKITIYPSDELLIGIMDIAGEATPGMLALGLTQGLASMNADAAITMAGVNAAMMDDAVKAEDLGIQNPFVSLEIAGDPGAGMLIRDVLFHCDGPGDVTIAVVDENGLIEDTQVIHQIPEPMTIVLLSLGGLVTVTLKKR
jgi:hypothetical protein